MNIHDVHRDIHTNKPRTRIGRGPGSGKGRTAGKGNKGHRARSGFSMPAFYEAGKTPLIRRIPKRGFTNAGAKRVVIVNVSELEARFKPGDEVNGETLRAQGLCKHPHDVIKVLGNGDLTKKLTVVAHRFSESAKVKITKAGGETVELPGRKPVVKNKQRSAAKRQAEGVI